MNKTKVIIGGERQKLMQKAVRWPCNVCGRPRGVGSNSIQCTKLSKVGTQEVFKCSGIKGSMCKVMKSFICGGCLNPVTIAGRTSGLALASAIDHMQIICNSLQADNHASTSLATQFLQAGCPSCRPTNSLKALKVQHVLNKVRIFSFFRSMGFSCS